MRKFKVEYQDPFEVKEEVIGNLSKKEIVNTFINIPWYENCIEIFYDLSSEKREKKVRPVIHEYWFFGIETTYLGEEYVLNIIPNNAFDTNFKEKDVRFSIEYMRPEMVKTSRISRFFGAPNEKKQKRFMSHAVEKTMEETISILEYFIKEEKEKVEAQLTYEGSIY